MATAKKSGSTKNKDKPDLKFIGSNEEAADSRTVASRQRLRDELSDQVSEFLARGGEIDQVERNVLADPPRKPNSNYGERPI